VLCSVPVSTGKGTDEMVGSSFDILLPFDDNCKSSGAVIDDATTFRSLINVSIFSFMMLQYLESKDDFCVLIFISFVKGLYARQWTNLCQKLILSETIT
jgi:hypothetical protein